VDGAGGPARPGRRDGRSVPQGPQPGPGLRDDAPPSPTPGVREQAAPPPVAVPVVQQQRGRRRGQRDDVRRYGTAGPRDTGQRRGWPSVPDPVRGGQRPLRGPGVLFVHVHAGRPRRVRVQVVRRLRVQRLVVRMQCEHVERRGECHQRAGLRIFAAHARAQDIRMQHVQHVQLRRGCRSCGGGGGVRPAHTEAKGKCYYKYLMT